MKINSKRVIAAVAVVIIGFSFAFNLVGDRTLPEKDGVSMSFKKGRLIEVAFLSIKPGKQEQLNQDYFSKVMPIAAEYGMKPLGKIKVNHTYSNFVKPQIIGFFEWPSEAKKEAFSKDPRFLKIRPIRNDALLSLRLSYLTVSEDTEVFFENGKLIEIFGMYFDPVEGHRMQRYFQNVMPLITGHGNKYGVQFPVKFTPVDFGSDSYVPQNFGLAIWKSKASNDAFFSSKDYEKIKADKDAALSHLDVWHGEIITP